MSKLSSMTGIKKSMGVLSHLHFKHIADVRVLNYAVFVTARVEKITNTLNIFALSEPENMLEYIKEQSSKTLSIGGNTNLAIANVDISFC